MRNRVPPMIVISFANKQQETQGLNYLLGRFSFRTWKSGKSLVPEAALIALAREGLPFRVEGAATYEQTVKALRDSTSAPIQRRRPRAGRDQHGNARRSA